MSYLPANMVAAELDEREALLIENFRMLRESHPDHAYMLVTLPAKAMDGDEQREAIETAVHALFDALAAVAR